MLVKKAIIAAGLLANFWLTPVSSPEEHSHQLVSESKTYMMTEDQALTILRSKTKSPSADSFVVIGKIVPTSTTKSVARQAVMEAQSEHISLYRDGVFVDLMRTGGFAVLEFDTKSGAATKIHLVTQNEAGEVEIQSNNVEGGMSKNDALTIIHKVVEFSDALFSSGGQIREILVKFGGANMVALGIPDGGGDLAIPERVRQLARKPTELVDLACLSTAVQLWDIRHALAMPVYAANPDAAGEQADKELPKLGRQFLAATGEKGGPDFLNQLGDLDSIHTRAELTTQLRWLRDLNSFLDKRSPLPLDSSTYEANALISTIPLYIGVTKDKSGNVYTALNLPGFITGWSREENGELVLKALSVVGDD